MTRSLDATTDAGGRGEQTRRLIVDTAIRLFGESGYEKTTMRAIAAAAGVSVGNAYYYFPSKDALVSEFYLQLQRAQRARVEPALARGGGFGDMLRAVLLAGLDVWSPHHAFAGRFIGVAAVPGSAASPFSSESVASRDEAMTIFRRLVARTSQKMAADLRDQLPELLWLCQLGIVVYWVHDRSPGQARTRELIDLVVPLLEDTVRLSRLKVFAATTERAMNVLRLIQLVGQNPTGHGPLLGTAQPGTG